MKKEDIVEAIESIVAQRTKGIQNDIEYWKTNAKNWQEQAAEFQHKAETLEVELETKTDDVLDAVVKSKHTFGLFLCWSGFCAGVGWFAHSVLSGT